jgi:hypothetical protein
MVVSRKITPEADSQTNYEQALPAAAAANPTSKSRAGRAGADVARQTSGR